ncbi:MAG: Gfo/Idh/MocA family oxidoreductase [Planctomycetota bacterium]|nr:MAG: Gfo/Idh/MocA family oxidoreductase [Planctomycetota bacterium]
MAPRRRDQSSRRQFLAAAGAGAVLGACALPPNANSRRLHVGPKYYPAAPPGPDEPIRIGVIGTGGMGTEHCRAFIRLAQAGREKVAVVAVADVCKPHLDHAQRTCAEGQPELGEVLAFRDYRELLKRPDIHGVLIASPEHWHAQMAADALRAGKDVYCEKPMTLRLPEALELRKVVLDHDRVFNVGTQHIMLGKYGEAKKLLEQGALGTVVSSQTSYCRNSKDGEWNYYAVDPEVVPGPNLDWEAWCGPAKRIPFDTLVFHRWRRYKDWSTGIVGDLLVHMMTPLFWTANLGWPRRVSAHGDHFVDLAMENHDQVNMTVQFDDPKHIMLIAGSTANEIGLPTNIRGHKGTLDLGGGNCRLSPERIYADEMDPQEVRCPDVADQDEMRVRWLQCMRSRETPPGNIDLATKVMVAVDLGTRSMWEGHAFEFDPDRMRVTTA